MNSTRVFYKLLIFVIFIFIFLVFLPRKVVAVVGCQLIYKDCTHTGLSEDCGCSAWCESGMDHTNCQKQTPAGGDLWCVEKYRCDCFTDPCGGGGCFVEGTEIEIIEQESERAGEQEGGEATEKIENLEPGDIVSSFNPETGEVSEGEVAEVHQLTREGYYELETESGKKVKVTGEHPFLAVKSENNLISKLKNALSNTPTYRLITTLQTKFF